MILNLHSISGSNWKIEIEKEFPKLFVRDELEVGKWYIDPNSGFMICIEIPKKETSYAGYGFTASGDWCKTKLGTCSWNSVPATDKEVSEALTKEAKKRGFKEGSKIKCLKDSRTWTSDGDFQFDSDGEFGVGAAYIFIDGTWATIIDEPKKLTVEEVEKKLGYSVEIVSK